MSWLRSQDILEIAPDLELVRGPGRTIIARAPHAPGFALAEGDFAALRTALQAVDGLRDVAAVTRALAGFRDPASVHALLVQLCEAGWLRPAARRDRPGAPRPRVRVLGNGLVARAICSRLRTATAVDCSEAASVAWSEDGDAAERRAAHCGGASAAIAGRGERGPSLDQLGRAVDLVVCALEGVPYRAIDRIEGACAASGVPCLVVTWEAGRFLLGPLRVPGRDGGFCAARASMLAALPGVEAPYLGHFTAGVLAADDAGLAGETAALLDAAVSAVVAEIECLPARDRVPALSASCQVIGPEGAARYPLPAPATGSAAASDLALAADIAVSRRAVLAERPREPMPSRLGSVGIIGGGTAGYLTALALRKKLPHLRVYLLESSRIPVIGVGEATTALLTHFLHDYLELDVVDFHAAVAPTFKLGIRFEWGQPGDHHFNSPFQFGRLLESLIHGGDLDRNCLASQLMSADRGPVARSPDGSLRSLLSEVPYAYHIDNQRFLRYLADQARRAGVVHLDSTVTEVALGSDGHTIERIFSDDGRAFRFDLYVDCTGFRSLLLGKTLGTPFITYDSSLPVDRAIVANVPHGGRVRPYTVAETMDSGWCWTIPMMDEDHRGYVHASAFCSEAQAIDEMRRKNPGMSEPWVVRFRSGRHRDFWRGNVVAIGNSYAFVEPLQSTAIHMIIVQIQKLVESFPQDAGQYAFQPVINREVAALWDHLRYFLALHYRYNQRCASEFWRSCRAGIDISGLEEYVALYQEKAPIAGRGPRFAELDASTFGVFRHDLLFMGLGLPTSYVEPVESCDSWRRITAAVERVVAHCLPHVEALQALRAEPGMLRRHIAELRGS